LYLSWAGVSWCALAGGGVPCILVRLFCSLLLGVFSAFGVYVLRVLLGFTGKLWLLLCILPVYLGAPYAFINKVFLLTKKKKILA